MRRRGVHRRSWHDHTRCLRARRAARKRQQGDVARTLDGYAQPALMASANARHPARQNLSALLHELRQDVRALVIDEVDRKSTRLNSSHANISYAVFCLKKKKKK